MFHRFRLTHAALLILTLLTGCHRPDDRGWQGYAEGEYLALAAPAAGYLSTLDAPRGTVVAAGGAAFSLSADPDSAAVDGAEARVRSADARLKNLESPRRRSEIATLEANVAALAAASAYARSDEARISTLAARRLVAQDALDAAHSRRAAADANEQAATQALATARETLGRQAEVRGARSDLQAAEADAAQKRWTRDRKSVAAPVNGLVADTYYRPGEWVAAGAPVLSVLPNDRRRIRFYVPETALAQLTVGRRVHVHCDGCTPALLGTVDYVAPSAEYAPPVIYSQDSRSRLVFRVEAAPDPADAPRLRPGLPLDVTLAP